MQNGMVDMVIVGCDRATANGDVANKIGTYMKALAARDNGVPFYSAFPVSSFDLSIYRPDQISIEERDGDEVRKTEGLAEENMIQPSHGTASKTYAPESFFICQPDMPVSNHGFDVTPAGLITGLITDRGICLANRDAIKKLLS
jgi:methylthioribose-1-phosphate isomerase